MRDKIKKMTPFILVAVLASSLVISNYNKAREVKAVVGIDDVAIAGLVTTILLAYGYATTQYYNNTDGANALADEWEEEYNKARFNVINGSGGSDDGDDDDDNDKFEDTDGDGKITEKDIPPFSNFLTKNAVTLSANASLLLTPIVTNSIMKLKHLGSRLADKMLSDGIDIDSSYIKANTVAYAYGKDIITDISGTSSVVFYSNKPVCIYKNSIFIPEASNACITAFSATGTAKIKYSDNLSYLHGGVDSIIVNGVEIWQYYAINGTFNSSYPSFDTLSDVKSYFEKALKNNSDVDWVTPELQDTFENKGNLELLPSFNPSAGYSMASQQALQQLLNNLLNSGLSPVEQTDLVNKFIAGLKTTESPDPDPNPDPDPSPDPDPNPDPDSPDDGGSGGDSDIDKGSFVRDLKTLFPFCIPFDLIDCIRLFNAEPVTPKIDIPVHYAFSDVDYTWTIDLEKFDDVAKVCRSVFLILFIVALILVTRNIIRG